MIQRVFRLTMGGLSVLTLKRLVRPLCLAGLMGFFATLVACSDGPNSWSFSKGQVQAPSDAKLSYYAAARFADQVAFGPNAALIADIQRKGYSAWIDEQFALPASQIDPSPKINQLIDAPANDARPWYEAQFPHLAIGAQDQLRMRVAWSLSQFLVISDGKVFPIAALEWANMLQRLAFSNYAQILEAVATSPAMGWYLDNAWNRPKSEQCTWCAPNENFAREFMQLFSIGVIKLNQDGSAKKDSAGRPIETYQQRDVADLARVLTGWTWTKDKPYAGKNAWTDWGKPMVASEYRHEHDWGEKTVMGVRFAAGQTAPQDLAQAVAMLMAHDNIAPFIALRMIQHLVMSNPSAAYVGRVAAAFKNNGQGQRGDMKAVVRAVLLDEEARRGDNPQASARGDGKLREPFQFQMALWRGLSCKRLPTDVAGNANLAGSQRPFSPETVFSFYAPTDTASGTSILAPEQRLVHEEEFKGRLGIHLNWSPIMRPEENASQLSMSDAACDVEGLLSAYRRSANAFADYLAPRFFRGAIPATLRLELSKIHEHLRQQTWMHEFDQATSLLSYALIGPSFGVIR